MYRSLPRQSESGIRRVFYHSSILIAFMNYALERRGISFQASGLEQTVAVTHFFKSSVMSIDLSCLSAFPPACCRFTSPDIAPNLSLLHCPSMLAHMPLG
jgi:hypothetical protein